MRNNTIDGFRLIAAFLVVCIHAGVPGLGAVLTPFYKVAVPFFFMISGFFLYDAERINMNNKVIKSIKRIVLIWFQATMIYSVVSYLCFPEDWINQIRLFMSPKFWLLNIAPFNSVLWYFLAYLYSLLLIYMINKLTDISRLNNIIYVILIIPCLILNYCIGEFNSFIYSGIIDCTYKSNFVTMGFPIVMIGMLCGKNKRYLPKLNNDQFVFLLIILYCFAIAQWYIVKSITHEGINASLFLCSTLPIAFFILCYSLSECDLFGKYLPEWGRLYSLDIYVYHIMFLWPILLLTRAYPSLGWLKNAVVVFFLTMGFVILKHRIGLEINRK